MFNKIWEQVKSSATMAWMWFCGLVSSIFLAGMQVLELLELPEVKQQVVAYLNLNNPKWVALYMLVAAIGGGIARLRTLGK
jgi:hypothetical protein